MLLTIRSEHTSAFLQFRGSLGEKKCYLLVAIRADAHEGSNKILAKETTVIGWRGTFIHVLAVAAVGS